VLPFYFVLGVASYHVIVNEQQDEVAEVLREEQMELPEDLDYDK